MNIISNTYSMENVIEESVAKRPKLNPPLFSQPTSDLTPKQLVQQYFLGNASQRDEAEKVATERRKQGFYTRSKQKDGGRRKTKRKNRRNRK
jgi:hypothetical protein